jgi:hypothetical protein
MDIFVKGREGEKLDIFAARIAELLTFRELQKRESSSYVGDEYFVGTALSVRVTFAVADEADLEGYDFWISIASADIASERVDSLDGLADLLARRLTVNGDSVLRLPSPQKGGPRIFYEFDPTAPQGSRGQVVAIRR